jgi:hypothetical protein
MTIEYKIDESDFLIHQLFAASKSDRIKRKRQRTKVIPSLIYFAFGLFFFLKDKSITFLIIGLLWFFIYPLWESRHYIKHYKGYIKEVFKDRFGRSLTLMFSNDFIIAKDNGSESKVLTKDLEEIYEIPSTIFVGLKDGQAYILPKDKIANIDNVKARLKELADYLKIKYIVDEKWVWK